MEQNKLDRNYELSNGFAKFYAMFEENRSRLIRRLQGVTDEMVDFTPDEHKIETIGTLLYHIAAVENDWIFYDIDKQELDEERWKYAFANRFEDINQLKGKGLKFYLNALEEVRTKIYERFKQFNDSDLEREIESDGEIYSIEWILYHLVNHEAQHIGQISLMKRLYKILNQ
ncbi:MAG: DinB family protein [Candidatus Heimdallarchaeota archaeon]|nr:DinB family protein [Candidatus Heimdallarchaeota archaeon]